MVVIQNTVLTRTNELMEAAKGEFDRKKVRTKYVFHFQDFVLKLMRDPVALGKRRTLLFIQI